MSLWLGSDVNVATFFAYQADWTRKRNFCVTPFAEWREQGNRFVDDDNGAEISFAKPRARALTSFRLAKRHS